MKIEKLNKNNMKEFIRDMKLVDTEILELNVDKSELYGIKKDDSFCLGFNSLSQVDTIAILYYGSKLTIDLFYECIGFLNKSLVVENHLIIDVYNEKYMKLLDEKYKCKEVCVYCDINEDNVEAFATGGGNVLMKEKLIDLEMKSIKYFTSKDMIVCNLVKQNIQDEKIIFDLHNDFVSLGVKYVKFTVFPDSLEYLKTLGYTCMSKSYVIRNDLF